MIKFLLKISLLLILTVQLKFSPITQFNETQFQQKTSIKLNNKTGQFSSKQNVLIYFFSEDQINSQIDLKQQKRQFQSTRYAYLKAKFQAMLANNNQQTEAEVQVKNQAQSEVDSISQISSEKQKVYCVQFFLVKCQSNSSSINMPKICQTLKINGEAKSKVFLFTNKSQILQFTNLIKQDILLFFLNKVKQNNDFGEKYIKFDQQLSKLAKHFQYSDKTFQQNASNLFSVLKSYITWNLLFFILIFIVAPFSYGFVSTKLQQRQNKQRLKKYASNQEVSQNGKLQKIEKTA